MENAPGRNVSRTERQAYAFPAAGRRSALPPVVVGMGPAGLFAALFLARNGFPCVVLERGQDVDQRTRDVDRFWTAGALDEGSNVQFGEGGAGTFSDGKLTTGTHDPRIAAVLDTLVEAGAPADVKYSHKPHVGTDVLRQVVKHISRAHFALGCDVRFGHRLEGADHTGGRPDGAAGGPGPQGGYLLKADTLVLAPGHSGRDTFAMLHQAGVPMEQKPFAVGVRIEHLQREISAWQYGPAWRQLPPSDYKLACHLPTGRSAFTFCVCPGGEVVAASSAPRDGGDQRHELPGPGWEEHQRRLSRGGGAGGLPRRCRTAGRGALQEEWERAAFQAGGGGFLAPAQRVEDFLKKRPSQGPGAIRPTYRPGVTWTELDRCLPGAVADTLRGALPLMDRKLRGFAAPDGVLTGVETRSSSPVRILRDETFQSALRGLYPCGEGAGYAGRIVSAAVDSIRVAEAVAGDKKQNALPSGQRVFAWWGEEAVHSGRPI